MRKGITIKDNNEIEWLVVRWSLLLLLMMMMSETFLFYFGFEYKSKFKEVLIVVVVVKVEMIYNSSIWRLSVRIGASAYVSFLNV